jgi:hypothetical protein
MIRRRCIEHLKVGKDFPHVFFYFDIIEIPVFFCGHMINRQGNRPLGIVQAEHVQIILKLRPDVVAMPKIDLDIHRPLELIAGNIGELLFGIVSPMVDRPEHEGPQGDGSEQTGGPFPSNDM